MRLLLVAVLAASASACAREPGPGGHGADAGDPPGGSIDGGDPGGPDAGDPGRTPDAGEEVVFFATEFAAHEGHWYDRRQDVPAATIDFGTADPAAGDDLSVALGFPGNPGAGPNDLAGPAHATEIATLRDDFHFGTYRARLRFAPCAPGEEVVHGFFTYFNDGNDHNGNDLPDNSEIDIEILCGTPHMISLTTWTDYDFAEEKFLKWSRAIDTRTGEYTESVAADSYEQEPKGSSPDFVLPGFPDPDVYYEMGFEWRADKVRWFIVVDGHEVTLWDYRDVRYIPQIPTALMFNIWHANTHWFSPGGAADYPAQNMVMRLDSARVTL